MQNIIESWNKTREYKKLRGKYTTKESTNLPNTSPTYLPTKSITQKTPKSPTSYQPICPPKDQSKRLSFFLKKALGQNIKLGTPTKVNDI